jgi:hypothetical protein
MQKEAIMPTAKDSRHSGNAGDKGLTNQNLTAPAPPVDAPREKERPQPQGLENRNVTQPAKLDAPRKQQ